MQLYVLIHLTDCVVFVNRALPKAVLDKIITIKNMSELDDMVESSMVTLHACLTHILSYSLLPASTRVWGNRPSAACRRRS